MAIKNTIICDDVEKALTTLSESSIDLIIADPPYGNLQKCSWDKFNDYYGFSLDWITKAEKVLNE